GKLGCFELHGKNVLNDRSGCKIFHIASVAIVINFKFPILIPPCAVEVARSQRGRTRGIAAWATVLVFIIVCGCWIRPQPLAVIKLAWVISANKTGGKPRHRHGQDAYVMRL